MSEKELSEEQLKELEAEMAKITIDDVLLQTVISLLNVGVRKAGLTKEQTAEVGSQQPQPDYEQLRQAIDGVKAILPLLEPRHSAKLGPIRDSLSHLQMIYVKAVGGSEEQPLPSQGADDQGSGSDANVGGSASNAPGASGGGVAGGSGQPGPAQRSGRLWVPGQK